MATSPDAPPPTPATASATPASAGSGSRDGSIDGHSSTGRRRRPPSPAAGAPQRAAAVATVGELHGALLDVPAGLVAEPPLLPDGTCAGAGGIGGGDGDGLWAADGLPWLPPATVGGLGDAGGAGGIPREAAVLNHLRGAVSAEAGGVLGPCAAAATAAAAMEADGSCRGGAAAVVPSSASGGAMAAATGTVVAALGVASQVLPERLSVGATSLAAALAGPTSATTAPAASAAPAAAAPMFRPPGVVAWHWAGVRVARLPGGTIHTVEVAPGPSARAPPLTSPALAGVAALAYRPYASDCLAVGVTAGVVVATSARGGPPSLRLLATPGHTRVSAVAWAPDGSRLASAAGGPATAGPVAVMLWAAAGTGAAADEAVPLRAFRGGVASLVWAPSIGGVAAGAGTLLATAALRTAVAVYEDAAWTGGPVRGLAAPAAAAAATPSGTILLALRGIADLGVLGGGSLRLVAPAVRLAVDDGGNRLAAIAADGTVTLYALGGAGGGGGGDGVVASTWRSAHASAAGGVLAVLWASGVLSFVQLVYEV
ncbi:hypothetical protein MMPV_009750 [Pyropia vietnamensis]